ncbi:hypothetical protein BGX33_001633 [Mortierella sp. NVP41]|nr:hypothetical protein BGX33_001633 [Mortierella sp. NVP41]
MSMTNSTPHISIFDIPHILDSICDHLSKDQLLHCLEVSRTWRQAFIPQALRHVRFTNLKDHQTWTILNSAAIIRPNYLMRPSIVDQTKNALLMIETSPRLHTLTVEKVSRQYRADHFTDAVFRSISTHKVAHPDQANLFQSLPVGIQDFEFSALSWYPTGRNAPFAWPDPSEFSETRYLALERLAIRGLHFPTRSRWSSPSEVVETEESSSDQIDCNPDDDPCPDLETIKLTNGGCYSHYHNRDSDPARVAAPL